MSDHTHTIREALELVPEGGGMWRRHPDALAALDALSADLAAARAVVREARALLAALDSHETDEIPY